MKTMQGRTITVNWLAAIVSKVVSVSKMDIGRGKDSDHQGKKIDEIQVEGFRK